MKPRIWRRLHEVLLAGLTLAVVCVTLFPIAWMVVTSLQTNQAVVTGSIRWNSWEWRNYLAVWQNVRLAVYFRNSLLICGAAALLATVFACSAGYALARYRFKGADAFGFAVLATQMIPGILFLLPIYMMFLWFKRVTGIPALNTHWGLIAVYTAFFTPMSIWIMRSFFAAIPRELEEAALVDGCTPLQALVRVILPLAAPGLVATGVYAFLAAWDELLFAWALTTSPEVQTIPVGIRLYVGQYQNRFDLLMAAGVVVTIPVLVAFFATQRWLIRGLTAGAVKG